MESARRNRQQKYCERLGIATGKIAVRKGVEVLHLGRFGAPRHSGYWSRGGSIGFVRVEDELGQLIIFRY